MAWEKAVVSSIAVVWKSKRCLDGNHSGRLHEGARGAVDIRMR